MKKIFLILDKFFNLSNISFLNVSGLICLTFAYPNNITLFLISSP